MKSQLHIYICEHYKEETKAVLSSGDYKNVVPFFIPPRCGRPTTLEKQLLSIPGLNSHTCNERLFCCCSCLTASDRELMNRYNIRYLPLVSCFEMFTSTEQVRQLIREGAYLITPGWLSNWKEWMNDWGGQAQAMQMFSESVTKLVLLDTGTDPDSTKNLEKFSEALNCPPVTINVGLDFYRLFLENEILRWQLKKKPDTSDISPINSVQKESDYAMALDLLSELPRAESEEIVAGLIIEALMMLFAPQQVNYLSIVDSKPENCWSSPPVSDNDPVKIRLYNFRNASGLTESGNGFYLRIGKQNDTLAVIEVEDVAMSEHLTRYQNLGLAMGGVFSLAIENSRNFQKIIQINTELKEANNTKDKFFSIIAHDLKNPFLTIMGFCEILQQSFQESDTERAERFITAIYDSTEQANELLENLLVWSKSQKGSLAFKPEMLDIKNLINEISKLIEHQASKKNIQILNAVNENTIVDADKNMLSTVIRNLLTNAVKFTQPGGKIVTRADIFPGYIQVEISDTGVGMDEKAMSMLFRIDATIKTQGTENEKGTGLGLILCREFIEKHGGKIWAKSELNKGSVFYFTIPR